MRAYISKYFQNNRNHLRMVPSAKYYLQIFSIILMELNISGAKVKSRQSLLGRLEPVLAGVVRSLRLDDVEGVGVARLGAGVLL